MVSRGNNLENKLGLVFYWASTQIISKWKKKILVQKMGNITTQINAQILKSLFREFLGSWGNWWSGATVMHHPHGFTPTNTCSTKNPNNVCLGHVAFSCQTKFQIIWESSAHKGSTKKYCLGYTCPWTAKVTNVKHAFMDWLHCKPLESTLSYWNFKIN